MAINGIQINSPEGVQQTLTRPQGEGYQQDMAFGMEHQRTLIMQQQARAAQQQAEAAQRQLQQQEWDSINRQSEQYLPKPRQPVMCNTFGSITTCY